MKLQVTQENLSKALSNVAKVAMSNKNPLPILSNVLLKTDENRLSISATNLEIAISEKIGSKVKNEGSITVPARLMQEYISSLPAGVIDLELDEFKLHISTEQFKSTINGVISDEYPDVPTIERQIEWSIPAKEFKKGLQQVVFAASNDDARPVLTGVYLKTIDGDLFAVATDSYRLSEKKLLKTKQEISLLVPASALQEVLRVIPDSANTIEVFADSQQVLFRIGDIELVSKLIDVPYPDYKKLIPKEFAVSATLNKEEFVSITKVSSLFARESAGSVTIMVNEDENTISIASIASQIGENKSQAKAKVSGDGQVTLNSRYLLDALNSIDADEVTFCFNGKLEPCLLTSKKVEDLTSLIMPLKS